MKFTLARISRCVEIEFVRILLIATRKKLDTYLHDQHLSLLFMHCKITLLAFSPAISFLFFFCYFFSTKNGRIAASESIFTRERMIEYKVTFLSEEIGACDVLDEYQ